MSCYEVYIRRNSDNTVIAQLDRFTQIDVDIAWNDVSTYTVTMPSCAKYRDKIIYGNGLVIVRNGQILIEGPIRAIQKRDGITTIIGADDTVYLKDFRALPPPYYPTTSFTSQYDVYPSPSTTAPLEDVVKHFVDVNIGPNAGDPNKKIAGLTIEPSQGRGEQRRHSARFDVLLDLLKRICGTQMGFRIVPLKNQSNRLQFQTYLWRQNTGHVIALERGNMKSYFYGSEMPTGNFVYVVGSPDVSGGNKKVAYSGDATSITRYGRVETVINYDITNDTTQLTQEINKALLEGSETITIEVETQETASSKLGVHYNVGDIVTLIIEGAITQQYVHGATYTFTADPNKGNVEEVTAKIGTLGRKATAVNDPNEINAMFDLVTRLQDRLHFIERRA